MLNNIEYYFKEKNIISDLENIYHDFIENNDLDSGHLYDNCVLNNLKENIYIIFSQFNNVDDNKEELYINNLIENIILKNSNICKSPPHDESIVYYLENKIKYLETIPQPEQRTPEWYIFRNNRLTASDLYAAVDEKQSRRKYDLILKKCNYDIPFISGDAINHGIKFEPMATEIYEKIHDVKVLEFGCLPHMHIDFFGASPDGIVSYESNNKDYVGRMLEIKCPKSRKIDGIIPIGYYYQIQGQLEVCDLEYCDFVECDFQLYSNKDDFFNDTSINNPLFNTKEQYKGIIIEIFDNKSKKTNYTYCSDEYITNITKYKEFESKIISTILSSDTLELIGTSLWYLNKINIVLVKRDREFFNKIFGKIKGFWDSVLYNRSNNCADIPDKLKLGLNKL